MIAGCWYMSETASPIPPLLTVRGHEIVEGMHARDFQQWCNIGNKCSQTSCNSLFLAVYKCVITYLPYGAYLLNSLWFMVTLHYRTYYDGYMESYNWAGAGFSSVHIILPARLVSSVFFPNAPCSLCLDSSPVCFDSGALCLSPVTDEQLIWRLNRHREESAKAFCPWLIWGHKQDSVWLNSVQCG